MEGYTSELWDFTRISVTQNNLEELIEIWVQWDDEVKQLFYCNYGKRRKQMYPLKNLSRSNFGTP
ncbi:hypothetical protein Godav_023636 [Gossypium davidsonii]|uniref:Uncharacterized protein n=2 Tax=Gossypium TaxID=3633 RepID=A0A7J8ST62_GOSDV|nr:hypothetical protein [Gossypium davidsonii]MBA0664692.1 hypothetical protein [Gossypium klotzschianum]